MNYSHKYDVCLILEGTYPFVSGGVSSWVHDIVSTLSEINFTAVCILPTSKDTWSMKYDIPDNFNDYEVVYLHDYDLNKTRRIKKSKRVHQINLLRNFHEKLKENDFSVFKDIIPIFQSNEKGLSSHDMIYGKDAWNLLLELQPRHNPESFLDYFWTCRFTHLPLYKILRTKLPYAKVYHSISTGFAGLLGSMAKHLYKRPFFITEHGIYTKERKIEISQADKIFTLYEGNKKIEIEDGADPHKIDVIPNGINIERFGGLNSINFSEKKIDTFHVGFVGRVVPIKDVKTFIRACKIVSMQLPNVKFFIMGPTVEDKAYYRECTEIVKFLKLEDQLSFTGKINVMDYYPKLHILVLTSISEAQPLVILEANCVGIPVVASDVGACSELLHGRTEPDKELGPSGIVTNVSDPVGTGNAIIKILSDHELRYQMAIAGQKRVKRFYQAKDMMQKYRSIYMNYIRQPDI
jgi:glycosyltransferase involved in cell wall biosynthesis